MKTLNQIKTILPEINSFFQNVKNNMNEDSWLSKEDSHSIKIESGEVFLKANKYKENEFSLEVKFYKNKNNNEVDYSTPVFSTEIPYETLSRIEKINFFTILKYL